MRKKIDVLKYLMLALCCLTLSGCRQTFSLEVVGFSGDRPIFEAEEEVLLTRIYVESRLREPEDETGFSIRKTSWYISVPGWEDRFKAKGKPIKTLTYGQLPEGFTEDVAPGKLIPGKYYQAWAYSSNRGYGTVIFKIVKDGNSFDVVEPNGFFYDIFGPSKPENLIPEDLEKAAESGDADAQYEIGLHYHLGDPVPQNDREAVRWYLKAAKQGNAPAMRYLADHYREGKGVPRDDNEAARWRQNAIEILKKAGAGPGYY